MRERKAKPAIRPTRSTRRVLLALLSGASNLSGYPLSRAAQVASGNVYVILHRLEREDWVAGEWEQDPPAHQQGQRRRFYRLTPVGREHAMAMLGLKGAGDE